MKLVDKPTYQQGIWRRKHSPICRECGNYLTNKPFPTCSIVHQNYYPRFLERNRGYQERVMVEVLMHYGGKCDCCGFDDINLKVLGRRFLQIHHVNGIQSPRTWRDNGSTLYRRIKANNYPPEFRVLCASCNIAMEPGQLTCERCKRDTHARWT